MNTTYTLPEREPQENIAQKHLSLEKIAYMKDLFSSMSHIICILNKSNQVIFFNEKVIEKYGLNLQQDIFGARPGELLQCINSKNDTGGCGTSEKCQYCGAFNALCESWKKKNKTVKECRIVRQLETNTVQIDLEITAAPFSYEQDEYLVVSLQDITEKKRKELLERIFYHDIINVAGSLCGIFQILPSLSGKEKDEFLQIADSLSNQIVDEIKTQQQINKAESGELRVSENRIETKPFLLKVSDKIRHHQVALQKQIETNDYTGNLAFTSDETILTRILINMAKNALEAIDPGQKITISARKTNNIRIEVHNPSYMEREIQLQLFQRSFSTKDNNRGIGTYSMKLLGEGYLNGSVSFESTPDQGTTFFIELPLKNN
ncbi:MAG: GHKL domain-containing protein [Prolixibacteraceae bacterium]|nr:GHKL domain-containing protein [Prolixibacteraceae bacterium]